MAFHVQVERGFRRAAVFNIPRERLRREVLDPWLAGDRLELGGQEWKPQECELAILEGPEIAGPELAHGRGWDHATRTARDVTGAVLAEAAVPTVVVIPAEGEGAAPVAEGLAGAGFPVADWRSVREGVLAGRVDPGLRRVLVVVVLDASGPPPLFESGLALGALAGRGMVVCLGRAEVPPELEGVPAVALDPEDPASVAALVARLRAL